MPTTPGGATPSAAAGGQTPRGPSDGTGHTSPQSPTSSLSGEKKNCDATCQFIKKYENHPLGHTATKRIWGAAGGIAGGAVGAVPAAAAGFFGTPAVGAATGAVTVPTGAYFGTGFGEDFGDSAYGNALTNYFVTGRGQNFY